MSDLDHILRNINLVFSPKKEHTGRTKCQPRFRPLTLNASRRPSSLEPFPNICCTFGPVRSVLQSFSWKSAGWQAGRRSAQALALNQLTSFENATYPSTYLGNLPTNARPLSGPFYFSNGPVTWTGSSGRSKSYNMSLKLLSFPFNLTFSMS